MRSRGGFDRSERIDASRLLFTAASTSMPHRNRFPAKLFRRSLRIRSTTGRATSDCSSTISSSSSTSSSFASSIPRERRPSANGDPPGTGAGVEVEVEAAGAGVRPVRRALIAAHIARDRRAARRPRERVQPSAEDLDPLLERLHLALEFLGGVVDLPDALGEELGDLGPLELDDVPRADADQDLRARGRGSSKVGFAPDGDQEFAPARDSTRAPPAWRAPARGRRATRRGTGAVAEGRSADCGKHRGERGLPGPGAPSWERSARSRGDLGQARDADQPPLDVMAPADLAERPLPRLLGRRGLADLRERLPVGPASEGTRPETCQLATAPRGRPRHPGSLHNPSGRFFSPDGRVITVGPLGTTGAGNRRRPLRAVPAPDARTDHHAPAPETAPSVGTAPARTGRRARGVGPSGSHRRWARTDGGHLLRARRVRRVRARRSRPGRGFRYRERSPLESR